MKKHKKGSSGKTAHADVYQIVTDRIVAALEQGTAPWRRPWQSAGQVCTGGLPSNALTGRCYSGVNVLLLWMAAVDGGYASNLWLTYRQAQETGGQVRKGETGSLAVIYKDWTKPAEDEHGNRLHDADGNPLKETVPMLRQLRRIYRKTSEYRRKPLMPRKNTGSGLRPGWDASCGRRQSTVSGN